ncbi:MAG: hypothetical protein ACRCSU_03655, partial [Paracoccaceae bacterium]
MGRWADSLRDLMLPFEQISLSPADLKCIGNATPGFARKFEEPCPARFSAALLDDLDSLMAQFPRGAHLRLDLCSFKNDLGSPRVMDRAGALLLFAQPDPRVAGLIWESLREGEDHSLFAFAWRDIPAWSEFRIFVRDGRVIGISQADALGVFPELARHESVLEPALWRFTHALLPRLPMADVVVDVIAVMEPNLSCRIWLIELNPLVHRSDPGLFTWQFGGDFDGSFRFRRSSGAPVLPQLTPALAPDAEIDIWRI